MKNSFRSFYTNQTFITFRKEGFLPVHISVCLRFSLVRILFEELEFWKSRESTDEMLEEKGMYYSGKDLFILPN